MRKNAINQKGFTIVELLIATTVFAVILLLCTLGLITVGRSYYKGITITRTQEVARNIMDDITQSIQFSGGTVRGTITTNPLAPTTRGFCVNDRRYTYIPNKVLADVSTDHAFVVDNPGVACSNSMLTQNITSAGLTPSSREFLLPGMRVTDASVVQDPTDPNLFTVHVQVISGPDNVLSSGRCVQRALDSQFCAVTDLTTVVQKRLK